MIETIVGGCLVLVGVLVTQLVHSLTANKDRKERLQRLLREKFEELCESILQTNGQIQQALKLSGTEAIVSSPPSAPQKAHYLAMIYFPELRDATREFNNSILVLYVFLLQCCDTEIPISIGNQAVRHPDYLKHQDNMIEKRTALEAVVEKNADRYVKA